MALDRDDAIKKSMDDSLRPLVTKGRERTRQMAKTLKDFDSEVSMIVSSPFVRAMETAEIICEAYKSKTIHQCPELIPSAPPQAFLMWLKNESKSNARIITVGHEPQLGLFAGWILAGTTIPFLEIKKSGVAAIELENFEDLGPRTARLKWLMGPKNL
jgi:phosphohistidine phosphatase